jgi:hypothetical protein
VAQPATSFSPPLLAQQTPAAHSSLLPFPQPSTLFPRSSPSRPSAPRPLRARDPPEPPAPPVGAAHPAARAPPLPPMPWARTSAHPRGVQPASTRPRLTPLTSRPHWQVRLPRAALAQQPRQSRLDSRRDFLPGPARPRCLGLLKVAPWPSAPTTSPCRSRKNPSTPSRSAPPRRAPCSAVPSPLRRTTASLESLRRSAEPPRSLPSRACPFSARDCAGIQPATAAGELLRHGVSAPSEHPGPH